MKKFLLAFTLLSILFTSCSEDAKVDVATLSLSETGPIEVSNTATQKNITITTNQPEWKASVNDNTWIKLTQSNSNLTIDIAANDQPSNRHAEVLIEAGKKIEKLVIKQSAAAINLKVESDKVEISNWEGRYKINVQSNTPNWTVEYATNNWFKIIEKQSKNEIIIEVTENSSLEKREAPITIKEATGTKVEFTLVQNGTLYYILPNLNINATKEDIIAFEKERRSILIEDANFIVSPNILVYNTKSEAFPQITYHIVDEKVARVIATAKDASIFNDIYRDSLKSKEFEESTKNLYSTKLIVSNSGIIYHIRAQVVTKGTNAIYFDIIPQQIENMDTFKDEFPLGYTDFKNATEANVKEWEKGKGGKFDLESSGDGVYWFEYTPSDNNGLISRMYLFENGKMTEGYECFSNIDKFFYKANKFYYMTKEFSDLLKKTGYEYLYMDSDEYIYYISKATKICFGIKVASFQDILSGAPVVDICFFDGSNLIPVSKAQNSKFNQKIK